MSTGHGGQVLLSGMTYGQVRDHPGLVDEEARLLDLGEHPLKDLTHPEHIYQLSVPDLLRAYPSRENSCRVGEVIYLNGRVYE